MGFINSNSPVDLILVFSILAILPFVALMVTSYVKIVIVLSLIRNALGVQQNPPNLVLNGMSIILSLYVMSPVTLSMFSAAEGKQFDVSDKQAIYEAVEDIQAPLKDFLKKHASVREREFFYRTAFKIWPREQAEALDRDSLMVLVPAFTVSELTAAFQIGFLIYLPFIAVDLIVSNVLLSMGMMMVSPMTISLPLKLLLFVLADGWTRLIHGLILTYS
ncbi:type III secretion system export apparatus subunit SctR [Roseiconus lacunae]|uniref:type III secretion system export apparatus subunit SctR n=1 Tax=Roseiconus lacunae TaxID=2605694 RepID=UPI001E501D64|nr:type III secretion system export apparatus subunit SctR [Roseiconus lacunae]MCD0457855.1 type III secretion system export apparatus subunit SctR [Roseiconus lacunae]